MAKSSSLPTGFFAMIGRSFKVIFTNLPVFFGSVFFVFMAMGALEWVITKNFAEMFMATPGEFPELTGPVVGVGVSYFLVSFVLGILSTIITVFLSTKLLDGGKVGPAAAFGFGFKKFWGGVRVVLRTILYMIAPLLLMVAGLIGFALLNSLGSIVNLALGLVMLFAGVWIFIRSVRVTFSYFCFVEDGLPGQKAVDKSIKTVAGKWWKVFGNYIGGSLVIGIILSLPMVVVSYVLNLQQGEVVFIVLNYLFSGLMAFGIIVFTNLVYRKYKA